MEEKLLIEILDLLKKNKKFPNYQAERRIDIFINHFLVQIIEAFEGNAKKVTFLCPEFPLLKKLTDKESTREFDSTKLDYLCHNNEQILFVELKTDESSLKESQADIYFKHSKWSNCLIDLKNLVKDAENKKSKYLPKYKHLQEKLETIKEIDLKEFVRILYLAPIEKKQKAPNEPLIIIDKIGKKYSILNPKRFSDLNIKPEGAEKIVWDFLCELGMYVFEVTENK